MPWAMIASLNSIQDLIQPMWGIGVDHGDDTACVFDLFLCHSFSSFMPSTHHFSSSSACGSPVSSDESPLRPVMRFASPPLDR